MGRVQVFAHGESQPLVPNTSTPIAPKTGASRSCCARLSSRLAFAHSIALAMLRAEAGLILCGCFIILDRPVENYGTSASPQCSKNSSSNPRPPPHQRPSSKPKRKLEPLALFLPNRIVARPLLVLVAVAEALIFLGLWIRLAVQGAAQPDGSVGRAATIVARTGFGPRTRDFVFAQPRSSGARFGVVAGIGLPHGFSGVSPASSPPSAKADSCR